MMANGMMAKCRVMEYCILEMEIQLMQVIGKMINLMVEEYYTMKTKQIFRDLLIIKILICCLMVGLNMKAVFQMILKMAMEYFI